MMKGSDEFFNVMNSFYNVFKNVDKRKRRSLNSSNPEREGNECNVYSSFESQQGVKNGDANADSL